MDGEKTPRNKSLIDTSNLSNVSAAVAVGHADTQERPQNVVAETLDIAVVGAE